MKMRKIMNSFTERDERRKAWLKSCSLGELIKNMMEDIYADKQDGYNFYNIHSYVEEIDRRFPTTEVVAITNKDDEDVKGDSFSTND